MLQLECIAEPLHGRAFYKALIIGVFGPVVDQNDLFGPFAIGGAKQCRKQGKGQKYVTVFHRVNYGRNQVIRKRVLMAEFLLQVKMNFFQLDDAISIKKRWTTGS
jgi:hypothetical protein